MAIKQHQTLPAWLGRAYVVSAWHVSSYMTLKDSAGQVVSMLYVGFTEQPFVLLKFAVLGSIGLVFFAAMIGATVVSLRWTRSIFKPLVRMEATMLRVAAGDGAARVGTLQSDEESGRLSSHLDQLLRLVDDKERSLQSLNIELDAKVAERTQQLADTQARLVRNEKLAAVGQLTAN